MKENIEEPFESKFIDELKIENVNVEGSIFYMIHVKFWSHLHWPPYYDDTPVPFKTMLTRFAAHVAPLEGVDICRRSVFKEYQVSWLSEAVRRDASLKKTKKLKSWELKAAPWFTVAAAQQYLMNITADALVPKLTEEAVYRFLLYDPGLIRVIPAGDNSYCWCVLPAGCKLADKV